MTTIVKIYSDDDLKKTGGFKKKNNSFTMTKEEFKQHVKDNKLTMTKAYIDAVGFLSNGLKFRASYNNIMIGVSGIIEELEK